MEYTVDKRSGVEKDKIAPIKTRKIVRRMFVNTQVQVQTWQILSRHLCTSL